MDADGTVACGTNPAGKGLSLADRPYFQEALASRSSTAVVMSAMTVSRATGKPAMFFAAPLERLPSHDVPTGVILAGVDLGWFARLSGGIPGLSDQLVQVLDSRDGAIVAWLRERETELVVLAGYTQLVTPGFLAAFPDRVINVHPALLPAFPGLHVVQAALDYGAKVFGVTVHFVDTGVDSGPIILQRAVELPEASAVDEVLERLHPIEHDLLVEAVRRIADGAVSFDDANPRRVRISR